jgi:hypothetical protein
VYISFFYTVTRDTMIKYIHLSRSIPGKLSLLQRSGKKGELAVDQFEVLLDAFRCNRMLDARVYCKRTKNGEGRIDNCVKYDLGNGYRLVTVLRGNHLFISFLGSHDETGVWIDRHRYDIFSAKNPSYECEQVCCVDEDDTGSELDMTGPEKEQDIYEEHLQALLDESTLREIFQGLYR